MIGSVGKEDMNLGWKGDYRPGNGQDWAEMMGPVAAGSEEKAG